MRLLFTVLFGLFFFTQNVFADTCPSIADIKSNHIEGWSAIDSGDGKPFDKKRLMQLAESIEQFALAESVTNKDKTTSIHCYYRDKHGSDLEAYLSKSNVVLVNKKNHWYQVTGYMHCAAGMENCTFQNSMPTGNTTFAQKSSKEPA